MIQIQREKWLSTGCAPLAATARQTPVVMQYAEEIRGREAFLWLWKYGST
jgi:TfoX/Sxy family transcriptional regulator of competence genes